jgi:hypothetical protein
VLTPAAGDPAVMASLDVDLLRVRAITPPDNPG